MISSFMEIETVSGKIPSQIEKDELYFRKLELEKRPEFIEMILTEYSKCVNNKTLNNDFQKMLRVVRGQEIKGNFSYITNVS